MAKDCVIYDPYVHIKQSSFTEIEYADIPKSFRVLLLKYQKIFKLFSQKAFINSTWPINSPIYIL